MSTNSVILGDSWVVATSSSTNRHGEDQKSDIACHTLGHDQLHKEKSNKNKENLGSGREYMTTSASTISGPELIMPSIYETPVSEASWVAPNVRSTLKHRHLPRESQRDNRHKPSSSDVSQGHNNDNDNDNTTSRRGGAHRKDDDDRTASRSAWLEPAIRSVINILLFAAISHMLVLPELVQQYQPLCSIEAISNLYPASCIPLYPSPVQQQVAARRSTSVLSSQTRLETLLNATLHEMAPLNGSLKQSESHLRDIQTGLLQAHPGRPRHELDLEFDGCWQATRAATKKFDSLRADIRSALDNLIATSSGSGGGGVKTIADPNVRDARLSTQMSRREHYLEQLTARMQSKADSLSSDLATLEDHLQSIGDIVARQNPPTSASVSQPSNQVQNLIESILPEKLPWFLRRARQENARPCSDPPITSHFQVAASEHHAVAEVVRNLSHRLQALQRRKPL